MRKFESKIGEKSAICFLRSNFDFPFSRSITGGRRRGRRRVPQSDSLVFVFRTSEERRAGGDAFLSRTKHKYKTIRERHASAGNQQLVRPLETHGQFGGKTPGKRNNALQASFDLLDVFHRAQIQA